MTSSHRDASSSTKKRTRWGLLECDDDKDDVGRQKASKRSATATAGASSRWRQARTVPAFPGIVAFPFIHFIWFSVESKCFGALSLAPFLVHGPMGFDVLHQISFCWASSTWRSRSPRASRPASTKKSTPSAASSGRPAAKPAAAGTGQRGRPTQSVEELFNRELAQFRVADASTNYFNSKWSVQARCIKNYIAKAESLEKTGSPEQVALATKAKHTFQMITSGMKMYAALKAGPLDIKAMATWATDWGHLVTFISDKKDVDICSPFLWGAHLEVLSEMDQCDEFPSQLCKFKLVTRGLVEDVRDAPSYQRTKIIEMLTSKLRDTRATKDLIQALTIRIKPFLMPEASPFLDNTILEELVDCNMLLCNFQPTERENLDKVRGMLDKFEKTPDEIKPLFIGVLALSFKGPGKQITDHACAFVDTALKSLDRADQMTNAGKQLAETLALADPGKAEYQKVKELVDWAFQEDVGNDVSGEEIGSSLAFSMELSVVSVGLAAHAIAKWSEFFCVEGNWVAPPPPPSPEPDTSVMLRIAEKLLEASDKGDTGKESVDLAAVRFCASWFNNQQLLSTTGFNSLHSDEVISLVNLGHWPPLQTWREQYSFTAGNEQGANTKITVSAWGIFERALHPHPGMRHLESSCGCSSSQALAGSAHVPTLTIWLPRGPP